ncbi:MAG: hypothetical protein J5565_05735 [Muribaculaceae bacterium]|nr:hypothetical protein [Muribaculaceae bacterium]
MKWIRILLLATVTAIVMWSPVVAANEQEMSEPNTAPVNYQELNGKIGPYAVKMFLKLNEVGDEVGYYYYVKYPKNVFKLRLEEMVAVNASGSMHVVLNEYTSKGVHSGTFDGQYECRGDYYAGTFTNSKGKRFKFVLQ